MTQTTNLGLFLHDKNIDLDNGFDTYRDELNGTSASSNMVKIDDFAGTMISFIANSYINAAGSLIPMTQANTAIQRIYPSNGGFEVSGSGAGDILQSWTEGALTGGSIVKSSVDPHSGSYCVMLSGSGMFVSQYITNFWSGSSYTLEYWAKGDNTYKHQVAFYDSGGSFLYRRDDVSPTYWKRYVEQVTIPSSPAGLHQCSVILYGANGGSVCYDDVSLYTGGSIAMAGSALANIDTKIRKIGVFSGSGQADFTDIPIDFTHLLIMGNVSVNTGAGFAFANVGIDFNGDSGSTNYATIQVDYSGSATGSYIQTTAQQETGQILIGKVNTTSSEGYNTPFFAFIPYYSGSTTSGSYLYKTAMGFSAVSFFQLLTAGIQGGVWLGNSASRINRIRVFGSRDSTTRINFHPYSRIDLYGIG